MPGWMSFVRRRPAGTAPEIGPPRRPASVAILGGDYPGLRPVFTVEDGERVRRGQVLFTDAREPRIAVVSPVDGTVASLARGARRVLSAVVLTCDPSDGEDQVASPIAVTDRQGIRDALLARGLWPAFISRPFGRLPDPDATPAAIFVNAANAGPGASSAHAAVTRRPDDFERGLDILTSLTRGKVFVCQSSGAPLATRPGRDRVQIVTFGDRYPTSLSSHHIHRLYPTGPGDVVWTIGCQDVIAIGHLFNTGHYLGECIVSLSRSKHAEAELFPTTLGANLREILEEPHFSPEAGSVRILSGPSDLGCESAYLRRHHNQISVEAALPRTLPRHRIPHPTSTVRPGRPAPIIPVAALDRALPTDIPPVPLMRALSIGDVETAERLGVLDLIEEDVALLTRLCSSGSDYGILLRRVLDELEAAA